MGKSIGFCCCSGSNEGFWQWEEDASFKPCFRVKDETSVAFQGRQVSLESHSSYLQYLSSTVSAFGISNANANVA